MEVYFVGNTEDSNYALIAKELIENFGHGITCTSFGAEVMVVVLTGYDEGVVHEIASFCTERITTDPNTAPKVIIIHDAEILPDRRLSQFISDNDFVNEVWCDDLDEVCDNLTTFLETA